MVGELVKRSLGTTTEGEILTYEAATLQVGEALCERAGIGKPGRRDELFSSHPRLVGAERFDDGQVIRSVSEERREQVVKLLAQRRLSSSRATNMPSLTS